MGTIISSRPMSVIYWKCFQPLHGACSGLQSQQDIEMNKYECITVLSLLLLFHCILPLLAGVFSAVLFQYGYQSFSLVVVSFCILQNDLVSYSYSCVPLEAFSYSFSQLTKMEMALLKGFQFQLTKRKEAKLIVFILVLVVCMDQTLQLVIVLVLNFQCQFSQLQFD